MIENKPAILVAQIGARKHYQEPSLFYQWGLLDKLYTDFYCGHNWLSKAAREKSIYQYYPNIVKKIIDRYDSSLDSAEIIHFPSLAYSYSQQLKNALPWERSQVYINVARKFCYKIIECGLGNANIVYGFDGACLELFEYAKSKGIQCILDQTIADRSLIHKLLLEEEKLWVGWSEHPFQVYEGDLELIKRQDKEQQLADKIICASPFVKDSLVAKGIDRKKISVVPLGRFHSKQISKSLSNNKLQVRENSLRILFAGSAGLRKGIQYLLQALREIKGKIPFTCKIAGNIDINLEKVTEFSDVCQFLGLVPRSQMKELYAWADVFVLPSICEGSAMVTYEALSCKLPIITTHNTGSIVREDIDGFIVPIRDSQEIANKLIHLSFQKDRLNSETDSINYLESINSKSKQKLLECLV